MPAPAYWLTFEDRPGYLIARVEGLTDSVEVSVNFWQEIAAEAHQRGARRLLVTESFVNNLTLEEVRQISQFVGELLPQLQLTDLRIAFFDAQHGQFETNQAGAAYAADYGVDCTVFASRAEAEAWLLRP